MISPKDIPQLVSVSPQDNYAVKLVYDNGFEGLFDIKPLFEYEVFKPLRNYEIFKTVRKNHNAIEWQEGIDLCADSLYLKITGETLSNA
jgi:hypothetical protein